MELSSLQKNREKLVLAHIKAEIEKQTSQTLQTFHHPRYEVIPTGQVYEGEKEVVSFLEESMTAFPDYTFETHVLHHTREAVIAEVTFHGTHLGQWRGLPATGNRVSYRMCNIFIFDGDLLVCERLYFDLLTVLCQLGIGRSPTSFIGRLSIFLNHPLTLLKAAFRGIFHTTSKN